MPKEFDKMRQAIKANLKKTNPKMSDEECEKKSWAMGVAQWKKSHGGKSPTEATDTELNESWRTFEFYAPITVQESVVKEGLEPDFMIKGTAITETTTRNNHKYVAEELQRCAPGMIGKPLLVDHDNRVESIKGVVSNAAFNPQSRSIEFEAKVMDKNIREMIRDGRIKNVSIGAFCKELIQEESTGAYIAKGMEIAELSLVAVPADINADFAMAMANNYSLKEALESYSRTQVQDKKVERRYGEMTEENAMTLEEVAKLKEELSTLRMEKRQALEESYKKLCKDKKVTEKDVSNLTEETVRMLIEQLKDINVTEEKKEIKSQVTHEAPKGIDSFMIERCETGVGLSIWAMPNSKGRITLN